MRFKCASVAETIKSGKVKSSKIIFTFIAMFLLFFIVGKVQAQNNINLLPDSGNVGIGTATPQEKFEVKGNAVIEGKLSMNDSLQVDGDVNMQKSLSVGDSVSIGSNLTVEENVVVKDSLSVGENVVVSKNLSVADTLTVGNMLKVNEISDVEVITTNKLNVNTLIGVNNEITFGDDDPTNPCDLLKINLKSAEKLLTKAVKTLCISILHNVLPHENFT